MMCLLNANDSLSPLLLWKKDFEKKTCNIFFKKNASPQVKRILQKNRQTQMMCPLKANDIHGTPLSIKKDL